MITKQQQLEFAAKHIEKWKSGYDFAVVEETIDGHLCVRWPSICTSGITKKEWQQERGKMQKQPAQSVQSKPDNSWHERGELPPVGCECEFVMCDGDDFYRERYVLPRTGDVIKIVAHHSFYDSCNGVAVFVWHDGESGRSATGSRVLFRPLRTERERAIDTACDIICKHGVHDFERGVITKLYDAGLLK